MLPLEHPRHVHPACATALSPTPFAYPAREKAHGHPSASLAPPYGCPLRRCHHCCCYYCFRNRFRRYIHCHCHFHCRLHRLIHCHCCFRLRLRRLLQCHCLYRPCCRLL